MSLLHLNKLHIYEHIWKMVESPVKGDDFTGQNPSRSLLELRAAARSYAGSLELGGVRTGILNCTKSELRSDDSDRPRRCPSAVAVRRVWRCRSVCPGDTFLPWSIGYREGSGGRRPGVDPYSQLRLCRLTDKEEQWS